jgi:hypothetical protein
MSDLRSKIPEWMYNTVAVYKEMSRLVRRSRRQYREITHLKEVLIRHNVPTSEIDWRFDNASDEDFDKGFFSSRVYEATKNNLAQSAPRKATDSSS